MHLKEKQEPRTGGNRAAIQQTDAVDSAAKNDQPQQRRGLNIGLIATIEKNKLEEIRVGLSEFNGHDLLNIRIWAEPRNGGAKRIPTKAGICCNVRLLPELIEALQKAEAAARERDLL